MPGETKPSRARMKAVSALDSDAHKVGSLTFLLAFAARNSALGSMVMPSPARGAPQNAVQSPKFCNPDLTHAFGRKNLFQPGAI